jgi:nucleotidyltransferase/DNA polymerase involved in DNA repair
MAFLSIFVPDFPVEAILRREPELRSQRVVVLEGKPPQQKIFAVNENAHHAGLEPEMTRLQAEAWPDLAMRCRSTLQEAAAHAALLDCAQSFSPRVEDTAPDTLVLDISGTEALFGPPLKLAREVAQRASHLGMEVNAAVASNPDAATVAARGYSGITILTPENQEERLGHLPLDVLFPCNAPEKKDEAPEFLEKLERWGIRTLRAFAALPEIAIHERLGEKGVALQKLARGTGFRTLVPVDPPLVFEEAVELEHPLVLLEPLAFLLNQLLEQICTRLSARALATQELRLRLELDPCMRADSNPGTVISSEGSQPESRDLAFLSRATNRSSEAVIPGEIRSSEAKEGKSRGFAFSSSEVVIPNVARDRGFSNHDSRSAHRSPSFFTRTLRLPVPMLDAKIFLKLLQLDLRAHPPGAPIMKIWLSAEPARLRPGQAGLFLPPSPEPEKLELTMARISGIVGGGNVGAVELLDTYRPGGFRMRHFTPRDLSQGKRNRRSSKKTAPERQSIKTGNAPAAQKEPGAGCHAPEPIVTALRLFRPPHPATVTMRDGIPARVECDSEKVTSGDISWQAGPWRSSGDWWEQEPWARDEWDIAVQGPNGLVLYRLVHDLLTARWFVEGTYD